MDTPIFNGSRIRRKLREGDVVVGTIMYLGAPQFVEMAAEVGYQWIFVDGEHGHRRGVDLMAVLSAAKGTDLDVIYRVSGLYENEVKTALDLGASGIVMPRVDTPEQIAQTVEWSRYAPEGKRGYGPLRADRYSLRRADYIREANDLVTVIAQIESVQAIENIDKIAATPGLDAMFMGMDDLRQSMGTLGCPDSEELPKMVDHVFDAARKAGIVFGTFVRSAEQCQSWIDRGARLMTIGSDIEFWVDGLRNEFARLKSTS
jgi:2-keto-3-deoxy-L-rhamnonate aldolase RhmA